jgi:hypothetical protein
MRLSVILFILVNNPFSTAHYVKRYAMPVSSLALIFIALVV